jgi:hypothetical protein
MRHRRDEAVRVGAGAMLAAGVAGWLVLLLSAPAHPAELALAEDPTAEVARLISNRKPVSAEERADQAEALLREARRERVAHTARALADLSELALGGFSPRRVWRGARGIAREVQRWIEPSATDAAALRLLEPVAESSFDRSDALEPAAETALDRPDLLEAYVRLRESSLEEQFEELLEIALEALEDRDFASARRAAERARRLRPASVEVAELLADVEVAEVEALPAEVGLLAPEEGEAPLAAALLAGAYDRALALESATPDADLGHCAALLLSGRREEGLSLLRDLADDDDRAGRAARDWLDDPVVDPEGALLREQRSYRVRRTLGWLGGDELEEHGLEWTSEGLRGWRRSLRPFNIVFGLPTRIARGRQARGDDLRAAARHYLEVEPDGDRAGTAREWVSELDARSAEREGAAWDDAIFVLPRARTALAPLVARPVRLSEDALVLVAPDADDLVALLDDEAPVLALALAAPADASALELAPERAFELLADLAHAFEEGSLRAASVDGGSGSEAVRRLEQGLRDGGELVAYAVPGAGLSDVASASAALEESIATGEGAPDQEIRFRPRRQGLVMDGDLVGGAIPCPPGVVCVDSFHALESRAFADVQLDGEAGVGVAARFLQTEVALSMSDDGPSASLTLPIASWLGLGRWIPLGARFGMAVDGVSIGIATVEPAAETELAR